MFYFWTFWYVVIILSFTVTFPHCLQATISVFFLYLISISCFFPSNIAAFSSCVPFLFNIFYFRTLWHVIVILSCTDTHIFCLSPTNAFLLIYTLIRSQSALFWPPLTYRFFSFCLTIVFVINLSVTPQFLWSTMRLRVILFAFSHTYGDKATIRGERRPQIAAPEGHRGRRLTLKTHFEVFSPWWVLVFIPFEDYSSVKDKWERAREK